VNLIGEHIDYAGLPVLPMALDRVVTLWIRPRSDRTVNVQNLSRGFGELTFVAGPAIEPAPAGDWGNYVRAAVQGVSIGYGSERGWDGLVESTVPVAAGLSSSSALVVAAGLSSMVSGDLEPDRFRFAERMAKAEQYVGTRGGGMDQAACIAGREGCAVRVEFDPLRVAHVPIPPQWRFIVADSGVQAHKSGSARDTYNRLRGFTERALAYVWPVVMGTDAPPEGPTFHSLVAGRTAAEIAELLGLAAGILDDELMPRFRHVVTEAARVGLAERALMRQDAVAFGELMNASHGSLRDDFGVSGPELDRLVNLALAAGAAGARLTGAGMGGCIVALCDETFESSVLGALPGAFTAVPSHGATVDRVDDDTP